MFWHKRLIHNNNPWHEVKVGIDLGYCNPTCFQARGLRYKNWCFCILRAYCSSDVRSVYYQDYCVQNSEESVHYNISYGTETILSTEIRRQHHNTLNCRQKMFWHKRLIHIIIHMASSLMRAYCSSDVRSVYYQW
jgi:hypothetical protein